MKKLAFTVLAGLMAFATTGAIADDTGKIIEDAIVYKHHWDVRLGLNELCTIKKGETVIVVKNITWLNGEELVHIKHNRCVGWTWQEHVQEN